MIGIILSCVFDTQAAGPTSNLSVAGGQNYTETGLKNYRNGTIAAGGTYRVLSGAQSIFSGILSNSGTISNSSAMNAMTVINDGLFEFDAAGYLYSYDSFLNRGTINLNSNYPSFIIYINQFINDGTLWNNGYVYGYAPDPANPSVFTNNRTFNNQNRFMNGLTSPNDVLINNGTFINAHGALLENHAVLAGAGLYINNGTLQYRDDGNSPNIFVQNDGIIDFSTINAPGITLNSLTSASNGGTFVSGRKTLTLNSGNYGGSFGDIGALVKETSGTLTLTGDKSTFSAPVTVNSGSLLVGTEASPTAILGDGTSTLTVQPGATAGGYGTLNFDRVDFQPGSTFYAGMSSPTQSGLLTTQDLTVANSNLQVNSRYAAFYTIARYAGTLTGTFAQIQPLGLTEIRSISYGSGSNDAIIIETAQANTLPDSTTPVDAISETVLDIGSLKARSAVEDENTFRFFPLAAQMRMSRSLTSTSRMRQEQSLPRRGDTTVDMTDTVFHALSQNGPLIAEHNKTWTWIAPYYTQGRSKGNNTPNAGKDHQQGAVLGFENQFSNQKMTLGMTSSFGTGQQSAFSNFSQKTIIKNKSYSFGFYHALNFLTGGRYDVIVNGIVMQNHSERYGNPLPGVSYKAESDFKTKTLAGNMLASWKFVLINDFSLRPGAGISLNATKRGSHTERNAGIYAQTYGVKKTHSTEPYAGLGIRKKWSDGAYDYKITGIIEQGYELGYNDTKTHVSTQSGPVPQEYVLESRGPGRSATYLTVYGSVFNKNNNLKISLSYLGTSKRYRQSHSLSLKLALKW